MSESPTMEKTMLEFPTLESMAESSTMEIIVSESPTGRMPCQGDHSR